MFNWKKAVMIFSIFMAMQTVALAYTLEEHTFDEYGISVSLPSDYYFFTNDLEQIKAEIGDDAFLIDAETIVLGFENSGIVAMATSRNLNEIDIGIEKNVVFDNDMNEEQIELTKDSLTSVLENAGAEGISAISQNNSLGTNLKMTYSVDGIQVIRHTVITDENIIIIQGTNVEEASDFEQMIDEIVGTLKTAPTELKFIPYGETNVEEDEQFEEFTYVDPDTGISFTVPAGWIYSEEGCFEPWKCCFQHAHSNGKMFMYGYEKDEKIKKSDIYSLPSEVSETFGKDGVTKKYGNNEYFVTNFKVDELSENHPFDANVNFMFALHTENGISYSFAYMYDYYDDCFEEFLESVVFAESEASDIYPDNFGIAQNKSDTDLNTSGEKVEVDNSDTNRLTSSAGLSVFYMAVQKITVILIWCVIIGGPLVFVVYIIRDVMKKKKKADENHDDGNNDTDAE